MDIRYTSPFELSAAIKAQTISSSDVLAYFLSRVEQLNPKINAVVALDVDRARSRALAADEAASKGEDWGPLHGVPLTIKDAFCTEGIVTVGGIPDHAENIPQTNAIAVQRYIDAGAIVFGKTNVPYMSADLQSFNDVYGVTNNPWNVERTCGGSSGGAGAALAAGLTPLELGSDIGGSIRTPSHFNGVFGHKPSYGIVSQRGHLPPGEKILSASDLSVVGPMGLSVSDIEQALDILVGPDYEDAKAYRIDLPAPRATDPKQLRVAVWADDPIAPVDNDIQAAIHAAADALEAKGALVDRKARPEIDAELNTQNYIHLLMSVLGAGMPKEVYNMMRDIAENAAPDDVSVPVLQARGIASSHGDWCREAEKREHIRQAWARFFQSFDVLLCPCANVTAFPHDHEPDMAARTLVVNGESRPYWEVLAWAGLTLNAYLPATAVPIATSSENMPIGVQVVADYLEDRTALAVAKMLEQHHRGFTPPPGY
ncbi:MAG: amidase [Pseudomonadota bacterium]